MLYKGVVTYYKNNHGFGYANIFINNNIESVYLHFSQMDSLDISNNLKVGDFLEFEIYNNDRNGLSASNIKLLKKYFINSDLLSEDEYYDKMYEYYLERQNSPELEIDIENNY